MKYSSDDIKNLAQDRMTRLKNDEHTVAILENHEPLYHNRKELRDAQAIQNANPQSRLFREISIDKGHFND